jgi:hypothetical protein
MKICLRINQSDSEETQSLLGLLKYQESIGCGNLMLLDPNQETPEGYTDINFGTSILNEYNLKKSVLFLSENPYIERNNILFAEWKQTISLLHHSISNSKKIIATNSDTYVSLIFKHQQAIFQADFPVTHDVYQLKLNTPITEKKLYVMDSGNALEKFKESIKKIKRVAAIGINKHETINSSQLKDLLTFEEIYWLSPRSISYRNQEINPISLSLAGSKVHVKDSANWITFNGKFTSELLSEENNVGNTTQMEQLKMLRSPLYSIKAFFELHAR